MNNNNDIALSNIAKLLSLKFLERKGNIDKFSLIFPDESKNTYGGVQGGMISSAIDEATFISILLDQSSIERVSSTNHHVLFHKPVELGKNFIDVKFMKVGKRVINIEGNLYRNDGLLAATLIHSASIIRKTEDNYEI